MSKSAVIRIATTDLEFLKTNACQRCFAKKVNDTYDVVWRSFEDYLANNTFSSTPACQIFGSNTFSGGVQVEAATNVQNITLGQQATLDSAGNTGAAATGGPAISIWLTIDDGPIHPGLDSVST